MKIPALILAFALNFPTFANAGSGVVVIDAANGDTDIDIQAALDANPEGTTFLLKGVFHLSNPIFLEKSNITIMGDYVDDNGDERPDESDTWNTILTGDSILGFALMNRDFTPSEISNVTIKSINFELVYAVFVFPDLNYAGCPGEIPVSADHLSIENNFFETSTVRIENRTNNVSIDNNLFIPVGRPRDGHAVWLKGYAVDFDCANPVIVSDGQGNSITNNRVANGNIFTLAHQTDLKVIGNTLTGVHDFFDYKIWTWDMDNFLVAGNYIQGDSSSNGVLLNTQVNNPYFPKGKNRKVAIRNNDFVDTLVGIWANGGLQKSTIKHNVMIQSGDFSPAGIAGILIADINPVTQPQVGASSKVLIANNHIADFGETGIGLNGETTGVKIVNNSFSNVFASADIVLAGEDLLFGTGTAMCPAHGNTVIATDFDTRVANFFSDVCGDKPNRLLGTLSSGNH
jgi:hypothetical protein